MNEYGPKICVVVNLVEHDVPRLERQILQKEHEIQEKIATQKQVHHYIEQLSNPFGFLNKAVKKIEDRIFVEEAKEMEDEKKGDHPLYLKEKAFEQQMDL
jgi:hypothetical protein